MSLTLTDVLLILFLHFVGDFLLQNDWMAQGKSERAGFNRQMLAHITVYALCLIPIGIVFAAVNALAHWMTDAVTSNATTYLWKRGQRHWFFVVIGADQFAHYAILFWTFGKV